jgi:hypothetical protein
MSFLKKISSLLVKKSCHRYSGIRNILLTFGGKNG